MLLVGWNENDAIASTYFQVAKQGIARTSWVPKLCVFDKISRSQMRISPPRQPVATMYGWIGWNWNDKYRSILLLCISSNDPCYREIIITNTASRKITWETRRFILKICGSGVSKIRGNEYLRAALSVNQYKATILYHSVPIHSQIFTRYIRFIIPLNQAIR